MSKNISNNVNGQYANKCNWILTYVAINADWNE